LITISASIFGIPLGTSHIKLGFDLPDEHYQFNIGPVNVKITLGPRNVMVVPHSKAVTPSPAPVVHEAASPQLDDSTWN